MGKLLNEVEVIAHANSEDWKYGLIIKRFDDEIEKVSNIITRLGNVIRQTQGRTEEVIKIKEQMIADEKLYRKTKEEDFKRQTEDIKTRIQFEVEPNTEDENVQLQEHYEKLKEQIEVSRETFATQLTEKDKQLEEMRGPFQDKLKNQEVQLTDGFFKYKEENDRLTNDLPSQKIKLKGYKKDMQTLGKSIEEKNSYIKVLKTRVTDYNNKCVEKKQGLSSNQSQAEANAAELE